MKTNTHISKLGLTASLLIISAAYMHAEQGRNYTTMQREEAESTPIMGADQNADRSTNDRNTADRNRYNQNTTDRNNTDRTNNAATSNRQQQNMRSTDATRTNSDMARSNRDATTQNRDANAGNRDNQMTRNNRDSRTDGQRQSQDLQRQVTEAVSTYTNLQNNSQNPIPEWVAGKAKGVLILKSWSGSMGIGGTGGSGIGLKKNADGSFSNPVFYNVAGGSIGIQAGASQSDTVVFLMSDRALQTLTENRFAWSGNLKAVAGEKSMRESTMDRDADIVIYNQSEGLDVGALVAGTVVTVDQEANRKFYNNDRLTARQIFEGQVQAPAAVASLQRALNNHAGNRNAANRGREVGSNMNQQQHRSADNTAGGTAMEQSRRDGTNRSATDNQQDRQTRDTSDEELGRTTGEQRREW